MEFKLIDGLRSGSRQHVEPAVVSSGLAEVRAYWEGLRHLGSIPARTGLDPRGISGALDRVFIAERIGTGLVRVRIAGSALTEIAGLDLRGLPLSCLFQTEARPRLTGLIERVFTGPIAAELHLEAERGLGRPALNGRLLLLPLVDVDGLRTLLLGCFSFNGGLGRAPRRFAIHAATEERLLAEAVQHRATHSSCEVVAFAAQDSKRHLRLVYSAD
jgi:hypothetical protein